MVFIDQRLLDRVAYGFQGGPTYLTTQVEQPGGRVNRNAERTRPKYQYSAPFDRIETEDHHLLLAAYNACLGPVHAFRFLDRSDFELVDVIIGTAVGGVDETMQLIKPYIFGSQQTDRPITKPVDGTITLTEDDVPLASTTDPLTGISTFTSAAGRIIRASGEFDVPVYFPEDQLVFTFANWRAHSTDVQLVEDFFA